MTSLNPKITPAGTGKVEMTWTPDPAAFGYRFYVNDHPVSKSVKPGQASTTFAFDGQPTAYGIAPAYETPAEAVLYPDVPPPPPTSSDWSVGRVNVLTAYGGDLAAAFASPDKLLYVPPGTYRHATVLNIRGKDVVFERTTLYGTNGLNASIMVSGVSPKVRFVGQCVIDRPQWTVRQAPVETQGMTVGHYGWPTSNVTIIADDLRISRAWGAGMLVHDTAGAVIQGNIHNTGSAADSFHTTGGSTDIDWQAHLRATDSGDDGAAIVSYDGEPVCQRVRYRHVTVDGNQVWGRGVACLGGKDCQVDYADISNSAGAGIYVACENEWNTHGVDGFKVLASKVRAPNRKGIHSGNVVVYNSRVGREIRDVSVTVDPDPAVATWRRMGTGYVVNTQVNGQVVS